MEKEIEYEVHYDVVATIKYIGTNNPDKDHYFEIGRHWADLLFEDELDQAVVTIDDDGNINVEAAEGYIRDEEEETIRTMMTEILK